MMAAIEVAAQVQEFTDYLVGSEEVSFGYPYQFIAADLSSQPGLERPGTRQERGCQTMRATTVPYPSGASL